MRKRVGVIFGGRSGEHEIAIRSARTVVQQIDHSQYEAIPIAILPDGRWLDPARSLALLDIAPGPIGAMEHYGSGEAGMFGDTRPQGVVVVGDGVLREIPLDVVFPVLHGTYGEDGTIQGLFEMADMPYVGCGVLASSCGMDKVIMKLLFREAGLPICRYTWLLRSDWETDQSGSIQKVEQELGYPCFVKPANLGSSVGVSGARDREELIAAVNTAALYDRKIVIEEALEMREIECAVLGNEKAEASRPGEYIIRNKDKAFLDYTEKYSGTGNNEFVVPAPISADLESQIREMAIAAFKAIDGSGLARVDFFLRNDTGTLLVNEINTMPGLTDASGYPKMWAGTGKPFTQVISELIEFAIERHNDRSRNRTTFGS